MHAIPCASRTTLTASVLLPTLPQVASAACDQLLLSKALAMLLPLEQLLVRHSLGSLQPLLQQLLEPGAVGLLAQRGDASMLQQLRPAIAQLPWEALTELLDSLTTALHPTVMTPVKAMEELRCAAQPSRRRRSSRRSRRRLLCRSSPTLRPPRSGQLVWGVPTQRASAAAPALAARGLQPLARLARPMLAVACRWRHRCRPRWASQVAFAADVIG